MRSCLPVLHVAAGALGLIGASALRAELRWAETTIERSARAGDDAVEAVFRFRNHGTTAATFQPVESSCGCTTAAPAKAAYAPGEAGGLRVRFDIGDRMGPQEKTLRVRTVENPEAVTMLTLRVDIRAPLDVSPRLLVWAVGEEPRAKAAQLQPEPGVTFKLTDPVGDEGAFTFALGDPGPDGRRVLSIVPQATTGWKTQKVDLVATDARGRRTVVSVHAFVR
jgi:hypothetical protein